MHSGPLVVPRDQSETPPASAAEEAPLAIDMERYCAWLSARNYSPFTIIDRRAAVRALICWAVPFGIERAEGVTRNLLETYRHHLFQRRKVDGAPLSFRTQIARLVAIRAFFKWLAREGTISTNPAAELDLPRAERRLPAAILAAHEVEAVLARPNLRTAGGLRDRAILETFYATGIRRLELVRLSLFDVDFARGLLMVRQGKGNRDRIVPTGDRALGWLVAYCDNARPRLLAGDSAENSLFLTARGKPLSPKRLSARVTRYVGGAGIAKSGSCHLFRHTAATLMLENGADIRFIQAMLGHVSLDTTQIYTHVAVAKLAAVHAATHPGVRRPGKRRVRQARHDVPLPRPLATV